MTTRRWFVLFGSVVFLAGTGWFVSELAGLKTGSDRALAQALTIRV